MSKTFICINCGDDFKVNHRKTGKINECDDCSCEPTPRYTGNMIWDHKTGCQIQINSDPELTKYITNATKLRNKGSNLGNNLKVSSNKVKSNGCVYTASGRSRRND